MSDSKLLFCHLKWIWTLAILATCSSFIPHTHNLTYKSQNALQSVFARRLLVFCLFLTVQGELPADSRYTPEHQPGPPIGRCTAAGQSTRNTGNKRREEITVSGWWWRDMTSWWQMWCGSLQGCLWHHLNYDSLKPAWTMFSLRAHVLSFLEQE